MPAPCDPGQVTNQPEFSLLPSGCMILLCDIFPTDRIICLKCPAHSLGFPGGSDSKESARSAEDLGSIPGLVRSPGGGHGNPPQYACLENPMDRGAWRAIAMVLQRVGHD